MKLRTSTALAALTLAALAGGTAVTGCSPANAAPATHSALWYDTATCQAFSRWQHRQTAFAPVTQLAAHANTYLRTDVTLLSHALGSNPEAVPADTGYVNDDCTLPAD